MKRGFGTHGQLGCIESVQGPDRRHECADENKLIALMHEQLISDIVKFP